MAAKTIVILGGGVGGLVAANELRRLVHPEHRIVLIEKNRQHAFAPSFLWLMTGDRRRWDGKEVDCSNGLAMIPEERQPSLRGIWISRKSPNPSRDTPFRKIETQFDQFAVNARRSPGRILGNHTEDQGANLLADVLTSNLSGS